MDQHFRDWLEYVSETQITDSKIRSGSSKQQAVNYLKLNPNDDLSSSILRKIRAKTRKLKKSNKKSCRRTCL